MSPRAKDPAEVPKRAPRDKGDGGLYEVTDSRTGRTYWRAVVEFPRKPNGKRDRQTLTAPTKAAGKTKVAELLRRRERLRQGQDPRPELYSFGEFLETWLEAIEPPGTKIKPRTWEGYKAHVERHIVPALGHLPIIKLTAADIEGLYKRLLRLQPRPLSGSTVRRIHSTVHVALQYAWRKRRILEDNPADYADLPEKNAKPAMSWTVEELHRFIAVAQGDDLEALWMLAVSTGARQGELLGLRWRDVDLDGGNVHIRVKLRTVGPAQLEEPKSQAGKRDITIPEEVVESLRRHRVRQQAMRATAGLAWVENQERRGIPGDAIFTTESGNWLNSSTVTSRYFYRLTDRAGVRRIRFHDMRHTAGTLLREKGVTSTAIALMLGHSDASFTERTYIHRTDVMREQAAEQMRDIFRGS